LGPWLRHRCERPANFGSDGVRLQPLWQLGAFYSHGGEQRELTFKSSSLNVITRDSKTGKSEIIDIIDYLLGRSSSNFAEGVIRRPIGAKGNDVSLILDSVADACAKKEQEVSREPRG
jgi:hypothetical protein